MTAPSRPVGSIQFTAPCPCGTPAEWTVTHGTAGDLSKTLVETRINCPTCTPLDSSPWLRTA